jgi:S1-C subfamily serine protease
MLASPVPLLSLLTLLAPVADGWLGVYLASDRVEAIVVEVIPDSPAAKAGLQAGDVLLAVGDRATGTREEFMAAIRGNKAGERIGIRYRRQDKEATVVVKLGERSEAGGSAPAATAPGKPSAPSANGSTPAAEVAPVRPARPPKAAAPKATAAAGKKPFLGLRVVESAEGVRVEGVLEGSPAQRAGVQEGEWLLSIGGDDVRTLADLDRLLARTQPGETTVVGVRSADATRSLRVTLGGSAAESAPRAQAAPAAPAAPPAPAVPPAPPADAAADPDLQRELDALRRELRELRRQVEELRRSRDGE